MGFYVSYDNGEVLLISGFTLNKKLYGNATLTFNHIGNQIAKDKMVHLTFYDRKTGINTIVFSGVLTKTSTRKKRKLHTDIDGGKSYKKSPSYGVWENSADDFSYWLRSEYYGSLSSNHITAVNYLLLSNDNGNYPKNTFINENDIKATAGKDFNFDKTTVYQCIQKILTNDHHMYMAFNSQGVPVAYDYREPYKDYKIYIDLGRNAESSEPDSHMYGGVTELNRSWDSTNLSTVVKFYNTKTEEGSDNTGQTWQQKVDKQYVGEWVSGSEYGDPSKTYGRIIKCVSGEYDDATDALKKEMFGFADNVHDNESYTVNLPFIPLDIVGRKCNINTNHDDKPLYGDDSFYVVDYWISEMSVNENNVMTLTLNKFRPLPPSEWAYNDPNDTKAEKFVLDASGSIGTANSPSSSNYQQVVAQCGRANANLLHPRKGGSCDCWCASDRIANCLANGGVHGRIIGYATEMASNHRSVVYNDSNGQVHRFPYRSYLKDNYLYDTDNVLNWWNKPWTNGKWGIYRYF